MAKVDKPKAKRGGTRPARERAAEEFVQVVLVDDEHPDNGRTKYVRPGRLALLGPKWQVVADEPPVTNPEPQGSDTKE